MELAINDDPEQCAGVTSTKHGQVPCKYRREPGSTFCRYHGARTDQSMLVKTSNALYDLDKTQFIIDFNKRVQALGHNSLKSLSIRNELGVIKATLERVLNECTDADTLIFRAGEIQALAKTVESMSKTCIAIDKELKNLYSLEEAKELSAKLLQIMYDSLTKFKISIDAAKVSIIERAQEYADTIAENGTPFSGEEFAAIIESALAEAISTDAVLEEVADGYEASFK